MLARACPAAAPPLGSAPRPAQNPHRRVSLGGETDYTLARVIEFCDGWLPRASPAVDPVEGMGRLRRAAEAAGRDMATLTMTVFRAPAAA